MKIKVKNATYEEICALPALKTPPLKKPWRILQILLRIAALPGLWAHKFKCEKVRMKQAGKGPFLILMNHSSFFDLNVTYHLMPRPFFLVCTADALIGKEWILRKVGCLPTTKFTPDIGLTRNITRALHEMKTNVLLFPEAGYSFDGTATTLPTGLGAFLKKLNVPVLSIITNGSFLRQPLYNNLRKRKVPVSAKMQCLFTREDIAQKSLEEIHTEIEKTFDFDNFKSQRMGQVRVDDENRAEGLHRVLYKCPACLAEAQMLGEGTTLTCKACGKIYQMDEYGTMHAQSGETQFSHIPDWFAWQRACVREEVQKTQYSQTLPVEVLVMHGNQCIYRIGDGILSHNKDGFTLTSGDNSQIYHRQPTLYSYSINADFNWYELGDVVSIGDRKTQFYCIPKDGTPVAKLRFAAEELYTLCKSSLTEKNN